MSKKAPLIPRNGHTLVTCVVARISGCQNQKETSLEDQEDHAHQIVEEMYTGKTEYRVVATKGKGESLKRPELAEILEMIRSDELDLLVCEDIGRIVRGAEAVRFCGLAVDHGTRVIAPHDDVDTDRDSWEEDVMEACKQHVGHNKHTSKRLKFKLMNRFEKRGETAARPISGYIVPAGAKGYRDWKIDPAAVPIYQSIFVQFRADPNASRIADWLNSIGFPTGKHCRTKRWDSAMVRRIVRNPLLKGMPQRGNMHSVKHHEGGCRISVRNPGGPKTWLAPHLTIIPPDEFDDVNALLDNANKGLGRKPVDGVDPLKGTSRKRSKFPGRVARCIYCGREYVWGGNGITENLQCNGARSWKCWNAVGFNGQLAAERIVEQIRFELFNLVGFDAQFAALVAASREPNGTTAGKLDELKRRGEELARQKRHLVDALKQSGPSPTILGAVTEIEADEKAVAREQRLIESRRQDPPTLPESITELRSLFEQAFTNLAVDSFEFAALLRPVVREFHVGLVRLFDGGHLFPRARVLLDFSGIVPKLQSVFQGNSPVMKEVEIDLFVPPDRERIRSDVLRLSGQGHDQRAIARALKVTQAGVHDAMCFDRAMRAAGLATPYVFVTGPPTDYNRLRRHKHPRYHFDPLPSYPRTN
jgi:site-specific DNA recombinase